MIPGPATVAAVVPVGCMSDCFGGAGGGQPIAAGGPHSKPTPSFSRQSHNPPPPKKKKINYKPKASTSITQAATTPPSYKPCLPPLALASCHQLPLSPAGGSFGVRHG